MTHSNVQSADRNSSNNLRLYCLNTARGLLLTSLVYVTWRFGGVDTITMLHTSILLLATGTLAMIGQPRFGFQARRLPVLLLVVIALSFAWPVVQTIQLPPSVYDAIATGHHEIDATLVDRALDAISPVLPDAKTGRVPRRSISVIRSLSDARIGQWLLMATYVLLSAVLFDTRKSRNVFLWTLAINTGFIAAWGLIQRTTGTTDLLPGVTRSNVILPFGPFIYKNAGAAAMIPGFAAAVGLLWASWLPRFGRESSKPSKTQKGFQYRNSRASNDQGTVILLTLTGLSAAGLLMSYSRGAWLAVIVATTMTLFVARKHISKRLAAILVGLPIAVCLLLVSVTSGLKPVADRVEDQLSSNYLYADARWEHWKDGLRTAQKYFPFGSGLGTYGYSTLAEQRSDSRLWFREAHNHYLETLTEQGLPGLLILFVGGIVLLRFGYSLLMNQVSRERSAIGLVGFAALIAISVQSVFDFVILIPAVMFLFAALFGMVAQTYISPVRERAIRTAIVPNQVPSRWFTASALWVIPAMICLVVTLSHLRERIVVEQVMLATSPSNETIPTDLAITANLDRLDECIDHHMDWPELYQRRAYWNLIRSRVAVRRASARAGNEMGWESTSSSTLFQKIMTLPPHERDLVIDDIAINSQIGKPLRLALRDLAASIELNPFVPGNHLSVALIAPTVGIDPSLYKDSLIRLSLSNPHVQFMSGLILYFTRDQNQMIDQWRRSLRATSPEFSQMVRLCLKSMSLREVAEKLIPADRSILLLSMIRSLDADQLTQLRSDPQIHRFLEDRIQADSSRTPAQQHALIALIATALDQTDRAATHWTRAVDSDRENSNYRYQYCQTLLKRGNYEELFRQCSLGKSLELEGDRFNQMMESARNKMQSTDR